MATEAHFVPNSKVIESKRVDLPDGFEQHFVAEFTVSPEKTIPIKSSYRKVMAGQSYTVVTRMEIGSRAPITNVVVGERGRVEGDYRLDQLASVTIHADGNVKFVPPREVKVLVGNAYPDLSTEDACNQLLRDLYEGRFGEFACMTNA
jgi:hypothetical protein